MPILAGGCQGITLPDPPFSFDRVTVEGKITVDGRPLSPGWVTFLPIEGTVGRPAIGRVRADGSYVARGVPVGRLQVRVQAPRGLSAAIVRTRREAAGRIGLVGGNASPLVLETSKDTPGRFDFDVLRSPLEPG